MSGKPIGLTLAGCLFAVIPQLAFARSDGPCPKATTTPEVIACLGDAESAALKQLEQRRALIRKALASRPELLAKFDKSELLWEGYREYFCSDFTDDRYEGGTIRMPSIIACGLDATEAHHDFLGRQFYLVLPRP
jgi:hypothetical protein